mmetsp:Transcript_4278/g.15701  ORF Transcript_4278/g.15701 Transcript_4278/m.15701 type:complete len:302 (-) Transcript_4278:64-969(-)
MRTDAARTAAATAEWLGKEASAVKKQKDREDAWRLACFVKLEKKALKAEPVMYGAEDILEAMGSHRPLDGGSFREGFEDEVQRLLQVVDVTSKGVVHGRGVVAKRDMIAGSVVVDPTAMYRSGTPPPDQIKGLRSEAYMKNRDGFFRLRWWIFDVDLKSSFTFFLNEAIGAQPNVACSIGYDGVRPKLQWKVLRPVRAGEELLYVYNQLDDSSAAKSAKKAPKRKAGTGGAAAPVASSKTPVASSKKQGAKPPRVTEPPRPDEAPDEKTAASPKKKARRSELSDHNPAPPAGLPLGSRRRS